MGVRRAHGWVVPLVSLGAALVGGGESDREGRSLTELAPDHDVPAEVGADVLDDGQPQTRAPSGPGAGRVDAVEALGHARQVQRVDPRPVVTHRQGRRFTRREDDLDRRVPDGFGCVERIAQEVDDHLLDPHSAAGMKVAREHGDPAVPMVVLATAHPAKFPAAVEAACGVTPALPAWLADLMDRKETFTVLPSDQKMLEDHVSRHTRAAH